MDEDIANFFDEIKTRLDSNQKINLRRGKKDFRIFFQEG